MTSRARRSGGDVAVRAHADVQRRPACRRARRAADRSSPSGSCRISAATPATAPPAVRAGPRRVRACRRAENRAQRLIERRSRQQQQLPIGEPREVARAIDDAGVDPLDLRRVPQRLDPRVHFVAVVGDRVAFGRREDDVQLIEAAEPARRTSGRPMTRPSCGSSDRTSESNDRRRMPSSDRRADQERPPDDQPAPAMRRADDREDQWIHGRMRTRRKPSGADLQSVRPTMLHSRAALVA